MTISPNTQTSTRPSLHPASIPVRHVTCVASGKGGVGKTWLSVTLSHALARMGQRTLLFDGDIGLANIDVQLGLMPERDLAGVVEGQVQLSEAIISYAGSFDVIAGRAGSTSLASLRPDTLIELRDQLIVTAFQYEQVILDLGAGVDGAVRVLTDTGGTVLVVTNDEPTSLTDAYAFIKLTSQRRPKCNLRIVINSALNWREGERTYGKLLKACESFLKISPPLSGIIRRDEKVRDAIRHQTSLLSRHPTSDAAEDVEKIASQLVIRS